MSAVPSPVVRGSEVQGVEKSRTENDDLERDGSLLFHVALAFGLLPGVSALFAIVGWRRLRARPKWVRRLVALATLDAFVLAALGVTIVVVGTKLGLGALLFGGSTEGGIASVASSLGPRPRIGVVLEDVEGGGARVVSAVPGSPAADAGLRTGDAIVEIDGSRVADRAALMDAVGNGPLQPRRLRIVRAHEDIEVEVLPVVGPFRAVPLDRERCAEAMPDVEATRRILAEPSTWVALALVVVVVAAIFAWGRRRGVSTRENARVLLPFVGVLFLAPTLGALAAALACPWLIDANVRYETVEIVAAEVVLCAAALGLLSWHRELGSRLVDEGPKLSYGRTLIQALVYIGFWMPRALLLAMPFALLVFAGEDLDDAPVAELVSGAGRTRLDAALTMLAAAVLAPIAEECLFRGVLAPQLARMMDGFSAIVVTALVFGVLHVGGHGPLFVGPTVLGGILGWARLRSGGLAAPITLHVLLNGTAMTLALTLGLE